MITDPDALRARIVHAFSDANMPSTELSKRIGRGADYIRDFIKGRKQSIKLEDLAKIEDVLGLSRGYLSDYNEFALTSKEHELKRLMPDFIAASEAGAKTFGSFNRDPDRIDYYVSEVGDAGLSTELYGSPVDVSATPWFIRKVNGVYGVMITDNTMEPAYEIGDSVFLNPNLPTVKGSDYFFRTELREGRFKGLIRRLVSWDNLTWDISQYNPPTTMRLNRSDYPRLDRVVAKIVA